MAEPADAVPGPRAAHDSSPSELRVSIRLISPSRDLADFPVLADLPASTTVGQIKARVENELAARRRSSSGMRMIFRGRVLEVDEKTLEEVFGISSIQETEVQTLHLVLRDGGANSNTNANANGNAATNPNAQFNQPLRGSSNLGNIPVGAADRATPAGPAQNPPHANPQAQTFYFHHQQQQQPQPLHAPTNPALAANPHHVLMYHMDAHARATLEAVRQQNLVLEQRIAYQQANLVPQTMPSPQDSMRRNSSTGQGSGVDPGSLTNQAHQQQLIQLQVQEQELHRHRQLHHQLEQQQHQQEQQQQQRELSTGEVQRMIMTAEAQPHENTNLHDRPTQTMPSLSQRYNAGASRGSVPLQRVGTATASGTSWGRQATDGPNVYILESPTGPRAILINGNAETYYTPATGGTASRQTPYTSAPNPLHPSHQWHVNMIQHHNHRVQQQQQQQHILIRQHMQHVEMLRQLQQQHLRQNRLPLPQYQQFAQHVAGQPTHYAPAPPAQAIPMGMPGQLEQMQNLHANLHRPPGLQPNNPGAGFLAAMWPHIWLVARLILFVWWFTAPTASWTRWAMVILLAMAVFIVNTGVLDVVANQAWAPIRAHLDGLLPFANPNGVRQQDGQDGQNAPNAPNPAEPANEANGNAGAAITAEPVAAVPVGRAGGPEPNPVEAAARLVAQRRMDNGQRLMNLARRLERVGVMFFASLAPGIAERHVALVEERERVERRRIQDAEDAAAAAAAAEEAAAEAEATAEANASAAGGSEDTGGDAAAVNGQQQNGDYAAVQADEAPLVVI